MVSYWWFWVLNRLWLLFLLLLFSFLIVGSTTGTQLAWFGGNCYTLRGCCGFDSHETTCLQKCENKITQVATCLRSGFVFRRSPVQIPVFGFWFWWGKMINFSESNFSEPLNYLPFLFFFSFFLPNQLIQTQLSGNQRFLFAWPLTWSP